MKDSTCVCLVLLLSTLTINLSWAAYDLDEKFAELEKKLDIILSGIGYASVAPSSIGGNSGISSLDSWITPLEVWSQPVGDNIKFTIKFKTRGNGMVKWWDQRLADRFTVPTQNISGSSEVQEVTYITQAPNPNHMMGFDRVVAMFYYSEQSKSIADLIMELTTSMGTREMTSAITLPPFGVEPLGDFVYDEGKNMTVKLRIPSSGGDELLSYDNFNWQVYVVDQERETVMPYVASQRDVYDILEINNETDATLLTIKFNTAKYSISGFIELKVGNVDPSDNALVYGVSLGKQVALHPSSQADPLRHGFLGFLVDPFSQDDVEQSECRAEESNCSISCTAVGEDIVDFTISRVELDGSRTLMDAVSSDKFFLNEHYVSTKSIRFPPKPTGTDRFECRVENSRGKVRVRTFEVTYLLSLDLLEDQSEVIVLGGNETSNIRQLAFVCTVQGAPAPNITFTIEWTNSYYYDYDLAPDELKFEDDIITATKIVTYDISDPKGLQGEYKGKPSRVACYAKYFYKSNNPLFYDYYQFPVPD